MTLPSLLAFLVIATSPVHWYLVLRLWRLHRDAPEVGAIEVAGLAATVLALHVNVYALVFLNNGMETPLLDSFATMVVTRAAELALVGPALYWIWIYRRGR